MRSASACLVGTKPVWRQDRDPVLARERGDRGCAQLKAAPGRPIRLADDDQVVGLAGNVRQQRNPEGPGAEERDPPDAAH